MTGEQGLGFITHGRAGPERAGTLIDIYKEALKEASPVGKFINDGVVVDTFCFCDEDGARARQRGTLAAQEQIKENSTSFSRFWGGISEDSIPKEYQHHYRRYQRSATQLNEIYPRESVGNRGILYG